MAVPTLEITPKASLRIVFISIEPNPLSLALNVWPPSIAKKGAIVRYITLMMIVSTISSCFIRVAMWGRTAMTLLKISRM